MGGACLNGRCFYLSCARESDHFGNFSPSGTAVTTLKPPSPILRTPFSAGWGRGRSCSSTGGIPHMQMFGCNSNVLQSYQRKTSKSSGYFVLLQKGKSFSILFWQGIITTHMQSYKRVMVPDVKTESSGPLGPKEKWKTIYKNYKCLAYPMQKTVYNPDDVSHCCSNHWQNQNHRTFA